MVERPNIVIPSSGPSQRDFVRELRPWWQQAEEKWWGKFLPENVRHAHDPRWRERTWSIQAAHDRKGIWLPVSWAFYTGMYAFSVGSIAINALAIGVPAAATLYISVYGFWKLYKKAAEDV